MVFFGQFLVHTAPIIPFFKKKKIIHTGTSRPESPHATENPWKITDKSADHSGSSRRSSNASANPPEVMVTKVEKPKKSIGESDQKMSMEQVMNLLPVRILKLHYFLKFLKSDAQKDSVC